MEYTTLSDVELVRNAKENQCDSSFLELKERHSNLARKMGKRFNMIIEDDLHNIFWNAIQAFKPERGYQFITVLGHYARYFCLDTIKDKEPYARLTEYEQNQLLNDLPASEALHPAIDLLKYVEKIPNEKTRKIIKERYFSGNKVKTYKELGTIMNWSYQASKNHDKMGIDFLRKLLKKELKLEGCSL